MPALGMRLQLFDATTSRDINDAFYVRPQATRRGVCRLLSLFQSTAELIVLAARSGTEATYAAREYVEAEILSLTASGRY